MRYEEEIPGEWEVDERGRRYRELGKGCIEFEPTVSINGLEIPQSELAAYNASRRAAEEQAARDAATAKNAVQSRQKPDAGFAAQPAEDFVMLEDEDSQLPF